jgi:hypothetical protein
MVQRHYPELPGQAREIRLSEARQVLVSRYLENVVAADRRAIERVFHVLNWTAAEVDRTLDALLKASTVRCLTIGQPQIKEEDGRQFVSAAYL